MMKTRDGSRDILLFSRIDAEPYPRLWALKSCISHVEINTSGPSLNSQFYVLALALTFLRDTVEPLNLKTCEKSSGRDPHSIEPNCSLAQDEMFD